MTQLQIEQFAQEFYKQALNLTLANPLLRLPNAARRKAFLELPPETMLAIADAIGRDDRCVTFIGQDASPTELLLAEQSRRPNSQLALRITLPLPHERVEATLRTIAKLHDELLEKRGLPCAFLALGTLNWKADDEAETRSPLLLVPVNIEAEADQTLLKTVYKLSPADRDATENPALREYLKLKHDLHVPRFDSNVPLDASRASDWLSNEAGKLTATKPAWQVAPGVVFGLFDCGAIAADCDAKNWPSDLNERPLLRSILLSTHTSSPPPVEPEFNAPSLVLEADGSQLSALQAVSRGASIVLHGPPGSGKSQTIVNLIAQAISQQKSVLFVAQKPEAAHVVQRRLAERGLSPFCTMLVPTGDTRNTKSAILEGLRRRRMVQTPTGSVLQSERAKLEFNLSLLSEYASALRTVLPNLQMTAREVLAELALHSLRGVSAIPRTEVALPSCSGAFTAAEQSLQRLAIARNQISDSAFSVLGGLRPADSAALAHEAAFDLVSDCRVITRCARAIDDHANRLEQDGCPQIPRALAKTSQLTDSIPECRTLLNSQSVERSFRLRASRAQEALQRMIAAKSTLSRTQALLPNCRELARAPGLGSVRSIAAASTLLERYGAETLPIGSIRGFAESVDALQAALARGEAMLGSGPILRLLARADDFRHWQRIVALLEALAKPGASRTFLVQRMGARRPNVDQLLRVAHAARAVSNSRAQTVPLCIPERFPSPQELKVASAAIASRRSFGGRFIGHLTDGQYRWAKQLARQILLPTVRRREWSQAMALCLELQSAEQEWRDALEAAGARPDSPADATAWNDACRWLQIVAELGREARSQAEEVWETARALELQPASNAELEVLEHAGRLCRSESLRAGLEATLAGNAASLRSICDALRSLTSACRETELRASAIALDGTSTCAAVGENARLLAQLRDTTDAIDAESEARELFSSDFHGMNTDTAPYERDASWLREVMSTRHQLWHGILNWMFSEHAPLLRRATAVHEFTALLLQSHLPLSDAIRRYTANHSFTGAAVALAIEQEHPLDSAERAANTVLRHESEVQRLFNLGLQAAHCSETVGFGLLGRFNSGQLSADHLAPCYRRTICEAALRDDSRLAPLLNFDRGAADDALASLPALDQSLRDGNAKLLVRKLLDRDVPQGTTSGRIREYTELGYIQHLLGLTRPRFEVQDLLQRAGQAIRALQPCVIATPSAVSEFLPRDGEMFDLLIIDEASQVPPAAAFGALARAKQAVIVGDPQQLPPTRFFMGTNGDTATAADTDAEAEEDREDWIGVTDVESILQRAISSLQNVHLCGHYRSRHHSLIAFSNKRFYDQRLTVTPSVAPRNGKFGIVAHHLRDAHYASSRNEVEAKTVAEHAMRHLCSGSNESLGIVAFNAPQAALIETHLEALAQTSKERFDAYSRAKMHKDPLFVRNLESVQGDERDVIFISYTYGPDPASSQVYQRFGPVLQAGGGRRLNVLVTRAKNRVEVFHSLLPSQITAAHGGGKIMREYLEYARQTPEFDFAIGEYESGFEEEVAIAIGRISPDLLVRPQVSCDKFRIDLGLSLRSNPDRFILGIECDGATYHSSQNARDRDLIRQMILEHHGWQIHRVWSTAWWKNSAAELERLTEAVRAAMRREEARALAR